MNTRLLHRFDRLEQLLCQSLAVRDYRTTYLAVTPFGGQIRVRVNLIDGDYSKYSNT
jgi:hypothetical protein